MYTALSVITALKNAMAKNSDLMCAGEDSIACPRPNFSDCEKDPAHCRKGQEQECKQQVKVHFRHQLLCVLNFYFMVSPSDYSGFIRQKDSALGSLLRRELLDRSELKPAKAG
jgi:hypothetical protein